MFNKLDQLSIDTIRMLSLDQVEKAGAGHPGAPLGQAPMAHVLWTNHLNVNPKNSDWFNRDRFVLSSGHGSPLIYSLLHLSGYDLTMNDLKGFRGFNTRTPGHPEVTHTDGVEATTGPLGQGVSNGVGMAMAEAHLAAMYNKDNHKIIDHYTYVIAGDGDLQEGVAQEASSLAGHLQLDKLILLYDSNEIQLDGPLTKAFSENIEQKYEAYGWHYSEVKNGTDLAEINKAIDTAKTVKGKPSIIEIKTEIGFGMPNAGTSDAHSDPIGEEGVAHTKEAYGWKHDEPFYVPKEVYDLYYEKMIKHGEKAEAEWNEMLEAYKNEYPELAQELQLAINNELPDGWDNSLPEYEIGDTEATRVTSNKVINGLAEKVPNFWGGSADLAASNKTLINNDSDFSAENYIGKNIWFGVREFAMGGIMNGITLHGGLKIYGGTFLIFSDYLRPAIRLAALSKLPNTYVFTHDSVVVGFDGATHEPVEHLASYRAMPNLTTFRPADAHETIAAWKYAMKSKTRPTILALSRQNLPLLENSQGLADKHVEKGAYTISPSRKETPTGIIIASGSEVSIAIEAQKKLFEKGEDISVVSMPSMELFQEQSDEYKESVLPKDVKRRLAVEAGSDFGWARYYGDEGGMININSFGICGPGQEVLESFGFSVDGILEAYKKLQ
ncbi:MAG: transketolase [Staphylococcus equorum]|nr:transketolase [Staphylococcus equorum]